MESSTWTKKYYNKKGHPLRVEDDIWRILQGLSTETVYLCHSANAEDTILAGGSAASPKAPPLRFFVESNATDHQEVSSFFFR